MRILLRFVYYLLFNILIIIVHAWCLIEGFIWIFRPKENFSWDLFYLMKNRLNIVFSPWVLNKKDDLE